MDFRGTGKHMDGVVEIGGRMCRIEVTGDICLRGPKPTQGCRTDEADDYIDRNNDLGTSKIQLHL